MPVNHPNIISSVNQPFKELQYCSKVSWQSVGSLDHKVIANSAYANQAMDFRCNSRFSIPARIENQEQAIDNRVKDQVSQDRKQKIKQCSIFRKKCWGQQAPKLSFLVTRTSFLVTKNYN